MGYTYYYVHEFDYKLKKFTLIFAPREAEFNLHREVKRLLMCVLFCLLMVSKK